MFDMVDEAILERRKEEKREEFRKQKKIEMLKQKGIALLIILSGIFCVVYFSLNPITGNDDPAAFFILVIVGIFLLVTNDNWYTA